MSGSRRLSTDLAVDLHVTDAMSRDNVGLLGHEVNRVAGPLGSPPKVGDGAEGFAPLHVGGVPPTPEPATPVDSQRLYDDLHAVRSTAPGHHDTHYEMPLWRVVTLSMFWYGFAAWIYLFFSLMVPEEIARMAPDSPGTTLGVVMLFGAVIGALSSPLFGALSDKSHNRFGRRRPYLVGGVAGGFVSVYGMAISNSLASYTVAWMLVLLCLSASGAAFNGLVADLVAPSQRGLASGVMGACVGLGGVTGAVLGLLYSSMGSFGMYMLSFGLLSACTAVTAVTTPETQHTRYHATDGSSDAVEPVKMSTCEAIEDMLQPFKDNDFRWVFLTRLMVQMGIYTLQEFLLFFLQRAVVLPEDTTPEDMLSYMMITMLSFALISPVVAGWVSDKMGGRRKVFVYIAGALMVAADVLMAINRSWQLLPVIAGVFGLAFGAFNAIDFAMALDVLPNEDDAAKDLGLWNLALVIPMCIAAPIGGILLDAFNSVSENLGFVALYILAAIYMFIGVYSIRRVSHKVK